MSDRMHILPFDRLLGWINEEYVQHGSIFGIPKSMFFSYGSNSKSDAVMGAHTEAPFGPAAGPHTQLAQNIICSYLTGCRFIELKTVQQMDNLEFEKPCIDADDEGYNTEWSQELSLEQSFDEYLKAWFALQLLAWRFGLSRSRQDPGFIFNMSVGYDLEGMKSEKMDRFVEGMLRPLEQADAKEKYEAYTHALGEREPDLHITDPVKGLVQSATISTMHGCPPEEIESMASYLMGEKGIDTYVKLNPTLLGGKDARFILQRCGWDHVVIEDTVFEHDLGYPQAVELIRNLQDEAGSLGRRFGIKLSNTLANTNTGDVLPGSERYMSGRPLFPLTINLAFRLASEFDGNISISYSGGASVVNIVDLLRTGIKPVTMTTDMLKPGGYLRFNQIAHLLHNSYASLAPPHGEIDVKALRVLAEDALQDNVYRKKSGKTHSIKLDSRLHMFDCVTAPCMHACPIHQDIPAYIEAVENGEPEHALQIIMQNNPLPHITGYICDHQCIQKCVRWDYDNPLSIRAIKRFAAEENDFENLAKKLRNRAPEKNTTASVAVVGAGPAGLASAFFLARGGLQATVFERQHSPGGTVRHAIQRFRLPDRVIEQDMSLIEALGVRFQTGWEGELSVHDLLKQGFSYVVLAAGSGKARGLGLAGSDGAGQYYTGIDFLHRVKRGETPPVGREVLVIGGGNSAVDAARTALRLSQGAGSAARTALRLSQGRVRIVYRRDLANMPADREEIDACIEEHIAIDELLQPLELLTEHGNIRGLRCARMKLGDVDGSGRPRPVPVEGEEVVLEADTVIAAIGEVVETEPMIKNGIELRDGRTVAVNPDTGETSVPGVYAAGDCVRGPATVVEAIADAKTVSRSILRAEGISADSLNDVMYRASTRDRLTVSQARRAEVAFNDPVKTISLEKRGGFDTVIQTLKQEPAGRESLRCLRCSELCSKCVEVCPNRANVTLFIDMPDAGETPEGFTQTTQILHIDDFCNECGNCETFCIHEGKPYTVKPTLFSGEQTFSASDNSGFYLKHDGKQGYGFVCRLDGHVYDMFIDGETVRFSRDRDVPGMIGLQRVAQELLSKHRYLLF